MRQALLIALACALACKSPQSKAEQARDQLASWSATGGVLSKEWARGAAPQQYVKRSVRVASDSLKKLGEPLEIDPKSTKTLHDVSALFDQLEHAVESKDTAAAPRLSKQMLAIAAELQNDKEKEQSQKK